MTDLVLQVDGVHPLLNEWQRAYKHWKAKRDYIEGLAWSVLSAAQAAGWKRREDPAIPQCCILVHRLQTQKPLPDWDGLISKALLDCLVVGSQRNPHGLGIIQDDAPTCVEAYAMFPGIGLHKHTRVEIFTGEGRIDRYLAAYEARIRGIVRG